MLISEFIVCTLPEDTFSHDVSEAHYENMPIQIY